MGLNPLQRASYRLFGNFTSRARNLDKLDDNLRRAQLPVRADAYLAYTMLVSAIVGLMALGISVIVFLFLLARFNINPALAVIMPAAGIFGYFLTNRVMMANPGSHAKKRARDIDAKLPYAANYITAMASAGIIPAEIFKSLAKQEVYGEAAREAAFIYKDLEVHGKDVVTAMRRAIDRSPSDKFKDLMQGAITTVTSGGDLTAYFYQKARRLQQDNRQEQILFVESMGLISEAYVTTAVALPLFLLVMIAIFVLIGAGDIILLKLLIYLLLPALGIGFLVALAARIPEA